MEQLRLEFIRTRRRKQIKTNVVLKQRNNMARLTKSVIKEREDFVRSLIKQNPKITGVRVQAALVEKFGSKMRNDRLCGLRYELQMGAMTTVTETTVQERMSP
jgi:hypothetical protein